MWSGRPALFEWFADLSPILRYGAAFGFLAAGGIAFLAGYFVPWLWGIGIVLLFASMLMGSGKDDF